MECFSSMVTKTAPVSSALEHTVQHACVCIHPLYDCALVTGQSVKPNTDSLGQSQLSFLDRGLLSPVPRDPFMGDTRVLTWGLHRPLSCGFSSSKHLKHLLAELDSWSASFSPACIDWRQLDKTVCPSPAGRDQELMHLKT